MQSKITPVMKLFRGLDKPMLTFRPIVDTEEQANMLQDGVVRVLDGDNGKCTHMVNQLGDYKVYNENATPSVSLRRYLYGPNFCNQNKQRLSDLDYRKVAFNTKQRPVTKTTLIAILRHVTDPNAVGFRYYCIYTNMAHTHITSIFKLKQDLAHFGLELPPKFGAWITKAEAVQVVPPTVPSKKTQKQSTKVGKGQSATMNIDVNQANASQMSINKQFDMPASAQPIDMSIDIPIPYTGMSITVTIRTAK